MNKNLESTKNKKEKIEIHAYVIIFILIIIAAIATWVVPAGQYDRVLDEATGRQIVQAGTFHEVEPNPVNLWTFWKNIHKGMIDGVSIFMFILIIGGTFGLLTKTGALNVLIAKVVTKFKGKRYEKLAFILMFSIFYIFTITFNFAEQGMIFVPFIVIMAVSLGYDPIVGVAVVVLATALGYSGSLTGPFNVSIAQSIAQLPMYSGLWYRVICSVIIYSITCWWLLRYASKVKRDPSKSLVADLDFANIEMTDDPEKLVMTNMHKRVLLLFGGAMAFMIFAILKLSFSIDDLSSYFLLLAVLIGIFARMRSGQIADGFIDGAKSLLFPGLLVAFARGIQTTMENGIILDSLINALVQPLSLLPHFFVAPMMVLVQSVINLIIPSASAMAVVTMPIMTPLADLLHIQRQTAVLAYQFGDGITNLILPTYNVLIGALGLAGIPFQRWFKFALPLTGILMVVVLILATIAEQIQVGPF